MKQILYVTSWLSEPSKGVYTITTRYSDGSEETTTEQREDCSLSPIPAMCPSMHDRLQTNVIELNLEPIRRNEATSWIMLGIVLALGLVGLLSLW